MKEGSIIKLDYDLWVHDDESGDYRLYETTVEQVARDNDIYDDHTDYEPITVIVGKGNLLQGVDASLMDAEIGKEVEVIIPPEKGYGERRPDQVEFIKRADLEAELASSDKAEDREIYQGKRVRFKGREGTVLMITGRKCRMDFNHPLAGKTLKYRYEVKEEIDKPGDIAREIAALNYPMGAEFEFTFVDDEMHVKLAEYCKFDPDWRMSKFQLIGMFRDAFPEINKIVLVEEYPRPETPSVERVGEDSDSSAAADEPTDSGKGEEGPGEGAAGPEEAGDEKVGTDEGEEKTEEDESIVDEGEEKTEEDESIVDEGEEKTEEDETET